MREVDNWDRKRKILPQPFPFNPRDMSRNTRCMYDALSKNHEVSPHTPNTFKFRGSVVTAFVLQAFVPGSSAMFALASKARGPKYYTSPSATNQLETMFKLCYAGFM